MLDSIRLVYSKNKNLTIEKYGIKLKRLAEEDLEQVRNWRNSPDITKYMVNKNYITPEQQIAWFNKITDSDNCFYFVIEYHNQSIGVCNIMDIDYQNKCSNAGAYIGDSRFLNSGIIYNAIVALAEFSFNDLGLEQWITPIYDNNIKALRFDKFLGYELFKKVDETISLYILTKKKFFEQRNKNKLLLNE